MLIRLFITVVIFLGIGCKYPTTLSGVYQNFHTDESHEQGAFSIGGARYSLDRLILYEDSLFTLYTFNEEGCYSTLNTVCGHWTFKENVIEFIPFTLSDTIKRGIMYLSDSSGKLTIEVFDQFGCPNVWPLTAYYPGQGDSYTLKYGFHEVNLPGKYNELTISKANREKLTMSIKRDSMHIKVYGLPLPVSQKFKSMQLAKNGSILTGTMYIESGSKKWNLPQRFDQQRKLKYYKWELK